jgi:hypothetical protein
MLVLEPNDEPLSRTGHDLRSLKPGGADLDDGAIR